MLIANPRRDIPATDLVAGLSALTAGAEPAPGQPILDRQAIAEYRQRRTRLDAEIAELEAAGAQPEAARARAERDWLATQLSERGGPLRPDPVVSR